MSAETVLSPRQRACIAALATGQTLEEAAATLGICERTVRRYMAKPGVRAALQQAQDDALAGVTRRMNAGAGDALDVLQAVMSNALMPPTVRVRAALGWLDVSFKARELLSVETRLSALEEALLHREP